MKKQTVFALAVAPVFALSLLAGCAQHARPLRLNGPAAKPSANAQKQMDAAAYESELSSQFAKSISGRDIQMINSMDGGIVSASANVTSEDDTAATIAVKVTFADGLSVSGQFTRGFIDQGEAQPDNLQQGYSSNERYMRLNTVDGPDLFERIDVVVGSLFPDGSRIDTNSKTKVVPGIGLVFQYNPKNPKQFSLVYPTPVSKAASTKSAQASKTAPAVAPANTSNTKSAAKSSSPIVRTSNT